MSITRRRIIRKTVIRVLTTFGVGRTYLRIDPHIYRVFRRLPVWDRRWYQDHYPDVRASGWDPLSHFLKFGLQEQRDPGPYYSVRDRLGSRFEESAEPLGRARALIADVEGEPRFQLLQSPTAAVAGSGLFDAEWYLAEYEDVRASGADPLTHYMVHGSLEQRTPGPHFDPHLYIHARGLAGKLPFNALMHYLAEGGSPRGNTGDRALIRRKALQHAIELLPLEPDLLAAVRHLEAGTMPVVDAVRRDPVGRAWRKLYGPLLASYRYVILVPWITHGGADLVALHVARLALRLHPADEVLLVLTEGADVAAHDWLPAGLHTLILSELDPELTLQERVELLQMMMRTLKPQALLNVNSHAGWELYEQFGRPLAVFTDLYAALFCPDYDNDGRLVGYAHRYFRSTLPLLRSIYFDNQGFIEELWRFYAPARHLRSRLRVIYQPAELISGYTQPAASGEFHALWAGRLSAQKNLQTLLAIARTDSTLHIDVYGRGDAAHTEMVLNAQRSLPNLCFHGAYSDFSALPLGRFSAYVYTTLWDGLPNALLAAAAAGIPIVAPAVGGIGELVSEQTGWLVQDPMDAAAYAAALRQIQTQPEEAARRAAHMTSLLAARHSWPAYVAAMTAEPSFLKPPSCTSR